jgi:putative lipoic acid-binding regulatory protein
MQFPCDFSIKIIGKNTDNFEADILNIARHFYPDLPNQAIKSQLSKNEKYRSLNLTVHAEEQTTLDHLYRALTQHPDVHMVL